MGIENEAAFEEWRLSKPDSMFAVTALSGALGDPDASPTTILDAYLFAKRTLARSMQSLLRSQLPVSCEEFHAVRARILAEMRSRFSQRVPDQFLKVPYGTKANERLFAVLHDAIGQPVDSALLRTINGDDIHTERRIRELRELGLEIHAATVNGNQHYVLRSLDVDGDRIRELVVKAIRKSRLSQAEQDALTKRMG